MELKPPTWRAWKAQNGGKLWYVRYPLTVEWALEWFVYRLRSLTLFDLLELAGRCTVLVVAILWVLEADDRTKERHYRAWELINAARGSTGDGGRRDALQDLNRDGVSLAGAPLERANLPRVDLENAELERADLEDAYGPIVAVGRVQLLLGEVAHVLQVGALQVGAPEDGAL